MSNQEQKRRYGILAVLLLILILLGWQFTRQTTSRQEIDSAVIQSAEVPEERSNTTNHPGTANKQEPELDEPLEITALDQYKENTRYPSSTRRLTADSHDLLNPGARYERRSRLPDDEDDPRWQVLFTADRFFVRDEEPILVSLQLWNDDKPTLPNQVSMHAEAADGDGSAKPVKLVLQTDGKSKTAVFKPNDYWPDYVGQIRVHSEFSARNLKPKSASLDFFFTGANRIPARFTGRISDRQVAGDLWFDIGLEVIKSGLFRLEASLFDASGKPFGWARYEGQLYKGKAIASLQFYGLLFHDAGAAGPYVLSGLHGYRLRPADVPHREDMQAFAGDYVTTGSYALNNFRSKINDSPRRQKMIQMYEDAERRGVILTKPEYTGDDN